jgi:hypothetical protein
MTFVEIAETVNFVFETMYFDKECISRRWLVCKEHDDLIRELQSAVNLQPWTTWSFIGVVGGKKYFVVHNKPAIAKRHRELIVVDFKAGSVLSRTAENYQK